MPSEAIRTRHAGWTQGAEGFLNLLWSLASRDVKVRYKQSALGVLWAVLVPTAMMGVFTFIFARAGETLAAAGSAPYPLYAFVGLVAWTYFASALNGCVQSLTSNRTLVTKVYCPREAFPLSAVAASFVDFAVGCVVLAALIAWFDGSGGWTFAPGWRLTALPALVLVQTTLTCGIGLALAAANLFWRDVRQAFSVAIQLGMFVSSVVVPLPAEGTAALIVRTVNPMVTLMDGYRACLLGGAFPGPGRLAAVVLTAAGALVVGGWAFRRSSHRFAECV
ncbi:MAG: hypothetical protein FLDDKLPJ_03165 [Phycisphaerae bacterium]|nr:hypothetical protein [Phycisphaerae bacterium]